MAGSAERARHWQYAELPGVDLLRASYVEKKFVRHTHEHFVIAAIADGVEVFHHGGADQYAGPGTLALVNPDTPHTGRAGVPEGWRYGAVYPSPDVVAEIAAETTTIRGTPGFTSPVLEDPYAAGLVHQVLRAVDEGNALAADTLLRVAVTRLLRLNGGPLPQRAVRTAGAPVAARARAVLQARMADPPTLERLAADLGTSPFALLRAFRSAYGMPPHTWLTDARVRRARSLLDVGTAPAEAAIAVGFTDQPHLNRHFSRIVGVPPGAYQRERVGGPGDGREHKHDARGREGERDVRGAGGRARRTRAQERTRPVRAAAPTVRGVAQQTALAEKHETGGGRSDRAVVRDALGVGGAVGLSGFAFGVTSAGSGLGLAQTCVLSLLVFTGASQFALVGVLAAGGNPFTAAAGAFFLGVRNAFYGLRLSQVLALPRAVRPFAAQWVIDETTAVTLAQPTRRAARVGFTVTGLSLYVLWNLTTLLGALGAGAIGDTDAWGLDAAGPAVFLALLAPMLRSTGERAAAGIAVVLGLGLLPVLPAGVPVLVAALAAPAVLWAEGRRWAGNRPGGGQEEVR